MITFLFIVAIIATYFIVGAFVCGLMCRKYPDSYVKDYNSDTSRAFSVVFWPVFLIFYIGHSFIELCNSIIVATRESEFKLPKFKKPKEETISEQELNSKW